MASWEVNTIAQIPNRTISCQDLLRDKECVHSGWLRRQSLRNKFKIFVWPHMYVVVAGGCLYCYSSEVARRPASAFSLYGYDKVFRAGEITEKEATWSFKLVHVNSAYRSYLFSASSSKEMKQWMSRLKHEMLKANGRLPRTPATARTPGDGCAGDASAAAYQDAGSESAGSVSSLDLKDIETSIYEDCSHFVLPSLYINKKEEDASDDEMDRVVLTRPDLQERPPIPPPVPVRPGAKKRKDPAVSQAAAIVKELKGMNVTGSGASGAEPVKSSKGSDEPTTDRTSKPIQKREDPDGSSIKGEEEVDASEFWSSIYFYGGRDKAQEIMMQIADDGVYLVRVNEDNSMVLHVYGKQQARKFIIFKQDDKYALDKDCKQFKRVADMIFYYYDNPLPRVDILLTECYLYHPSYNNLHFS